MECDRKSVVDPALRSASAEQKDSTHRTLDGLPVQSFHGLMANLAQLTVAWVRVDGQSETVALKSSPTDLQHRALTLLNIRV